MVTKHNVGSAAALKLSGVKNWSNRDRQPITEGGRLAKKADTAANRRTSRFSGSVLILASLAL